MFCDRKIRLAILIDDAMYHRTIHPDDLAHLMTFAEIVNPPPYPDAIDAAYMKAHLAGAEVCMTCWGTPVLDSEILAAAPGLKLILHGAGTPKAIVSDAVWARGIRVATAAPVIAMDVAESALGGIITCLKHFADFDRIVREGRWSTRYTSGAASAVNDLKPKMKRLNGMLTVGIVGASHVGRHLIRFLQPFGVRILLYDPTVSPSMARDLDAEIASLEDLMAGSDVVSIHAPQLPSTRQMITGQHLAAMQDGALFVNTARGSIVDQDALLRELKRGRINAYLDVFETEPLPDADEWASLPNVLLTPHISGGHTVNGGFERGHYLVSQLWRYCSTGSLLHEAREDMLDMMA